MHPTFAAGLIAVPGFVDMHVHVAGGGGEAGPASRTPEARLSELLLAGITTVVGLTGTDSVSRSQAGGEKGCRCRCVPGPCLAHRPCNRSRFPVTLLPLSPFPAGEPDCQGAGAVHGWHHCFQLVRIVRAATRHGHRLCAARAVPNRQLRGRGGGGG